MISETCGNCSSKMMLNATIEGGSLCVTTPYHPEFVRKARRLGGKWHPDLKVWSFPLTRKDWVFDVVREVYGAAPGAETVTVRITAKRRVSSDRDAVRFAALPVIVARNRDGGARPGPGCALLSGEVTSGGSARYWETIVLAGAVIEVPGVPKKLAVEDEDWAVEILN